MIDSDDDRDLAERGVLRRELEDIATDSFDDPPRSLVVSGLAMLVIAAIVGVVGWWLIRGGMSDGASGLSAAGSRYRGDRDAELNSHWFLLTSGIGAAALATVFGLFGMLSIARACVPRSGE